LEDLPDPQQERQLRARRGRSGINLILFSILFGLALGVAQSPFFWVREVQVLAPDPELKAAAQQALDLPPEASTLLYPVSRLEAQLRSDPHILSAEVGRELPSRLTIRVARRRPVAILELDSRRLLVGGDGVITDLVSAGGALPKLPVIAGLSLPETAPGQRLPARAAALVTSIAAAASASGLLGKLRVDCSRAPDLRLLTGGVEGLVWEQDNFERNILLFAILKRELEQRGEKPARIDLKLDPPRWESRSEQTTGAPAEQGLAPQGDRVGH
jgi:hypothetical protein